MQDIGGARFVFDTIEALERCKKTLEDFTPSGFTFVRTTDYIETPKQSGYRSIHYVYQYHSEDTELDGLKIELQIRTRLEHSWAMAVETASLISRTSLKANIEDGSRTYPADEEGRATSTFAQLEQNIDSNEAVLLVSIAKMQEIREAYPSYFLDTNEFLKALTEFDNSCKVRN